MRSGRASSTASGREEPLGGARDFAQPLLQAELIALRIGQDETTPTDGGDVIHIGDVLQGIHVGFECQFAQDARTEAGKPAQLVGQL